MADIEKTGIGQYETEEFYIYIPGDPGTIDRFENTIASGVHFGSFADWSKLQDFVAQSCGVTRDRVLVEDKP